MADTGFDTQHHIAPETTGEISFARFPSVNTLNLYGPLGVPPFSPASSPSNMVVFYSSAYATGHSIVYAKSWNLLSCLRKVPFPVEVGLSPNHGFECFWARNIVSPENDILLILSL